MGTIFLYSIGRTTTFLRNRVVLADLNLDSTFRSKFRNDNAVGDLLERSWVGLASQTVIKCMKICRSNDLL